MTRSNTANGGTSYYDLEIQVLSATDAAYGLRAVIYLTSLNVSDSTNNLSVTGNWSRSGAQALSGVYNNAVVWYQDITVNRIVGSAQTVTVNVAWSAVEYWGTTLSATNSYVVPAAPSPVGPPCAPPTGAELITQVGARIVVFPAPCNGGAPIIGYEAYVLSNNAFPGSGGVVVDSASGGTFTTTKLKPLTQYWYTARSVNNAGYYSAFTTMGTFTTNATERVKAGGTWHGGVALVKVAGAWRNVMQGYVKVGGTWHSW